MLHIHREFSTHLKWNSYSSNLELKSKLYFVKKQRISPSWCSPSKLLWKFFGIQDRVAYWGLSFTSYKVFSKLKSRSGTSLLASFSAWFLMKNKSLCYSLLTNQISLSGCLHLVRYWAICALQFFVNQVVAS